MGIISYAQNFEDVLLTRIFANLNHGFYVDIGAYHPVEDSVTKTFYDRGWSGINIEPGEIFDELAAARPRDINLNMAVYDRTGKISFVQHPGWYAGLSHVQDADSAESFDQSGVKTRTVVCDTLGNILERHGNRRPIAFIKIDAEGAEFAIIKSTNWRLIRPTVLLIEATLPLSTELDNHDWEPILLEQGYHRAYFDGINCFYVPEERADLLRCFVLPVNVLDGFVRPDPPALVTLRDELSSAHERLATTSNELAHLQAENSALRDQNFLHLTTMSTHDRILSELRQQFNDRVETVKTEHLRREAEQQATVAAQLAEARGAWDRQVALLQEDSEQRIGAVYAKCAALEHRLVEMGQQEVALSASAMRLHRLIFELRWPDGPRSLRMVLPLARVIRRLNGTRPPDVSPALLVTVGGTFQGSHSLLGGGSAAAPPKRSLRKRLAWLVYGPLRPIIRPTVWRLRAFMIGELIERLGLLDQRVVGLAAAPPQQSPIPVTSESRSDSTAAEMRRLAVEMERTLLTLALERAPDPWRRGQSAPTQADTSAGEPEQAAFSFVPLSLPNGTGYELSVDEGDPDAFHRAVATGGANDTNWRFIIRWVRPGNVFFDVGANIGTISIPVALCGATVHSFELLTSNVQHLLRSAERNAIQTLSVVLGAVSDKHEPAGVGGTSAWGTVVETATLSIAAVVLDVYAETRGIEVVDLMKIDVEGSELAALRGSVGIIEKYSPDIIIEGNVVTSGNAGYSYKDILVFLVDRGYQIFRLHSDRLCPWEPSNTQEVVYVDYLATKKPRAEIEERSGWAISTMTNEEIVNSIELQGSMPPLHKQYVLAVAKQFPTQVAADPRVTVLLENWQDLDDDGVREVMQVGAQ